MYLALAGGVGGSKMAHGLAMALPPGALTVVVNTGDDSEHFGLLVSPDVDTVMYTLAGLNNTETGWGLAGETWSFMDAVESLGGPTWFRLGDRDLATKAERTRRLRAGESLSAITRDFCRKLTILQHIVPMSDDPVRIMIDSDEGLLAFHDYFVQRRWQPRMHSVILEGIESAHPSQGLLDALAAPDLEGIILCPSNPYVSIGPILALPGVRDMIRTAAVPVVAVSPIVGGAALKGPAAKMMAEQGIEPSIRGLASLYGTLIDGLVIDTGDAPEAAGLVEPGIHAAPTIMTDDDSKRRLAEEVIAFLDQLRAAS